MKKIAVLLAVLWVLFHWGGSTGTDGIDGDSSSEFNGWDMEVCQGGADYYKIEGALHICINW